MSLKFRIADQVLRVDDERDATEAVVHKYDAFLNLLCVDLYAFQREAVREALRFLVSDRYPNLEQLARKNWNMQEAIRQRYETLDAYISHMPLRAKKSISLDLATGTGKSFVMYALAAIALAEGLAERVLVLCPSLTIEEGLLKKFMMLAGNSELSSIMNELGASVGIPGIRRGNGTIQSGDICIENIHAVYENTGSAIRDSFRGLGARTLVLNDEAHHLFSPPDQGMRKWMEFLQSEEFGFQQIVNVTGTPYVGNDYFPDVVFRYGLKQAIADRVVKKPNYKLEDTYASHDWQKTYAVHQMNWAKYGNEAKPISIIVTADIASCVEVWRELVDFLAAKEEIGVKEAEQKAIWVTSGIPSNKIAKTRVEAAYSPRSDEDSPEKRRKDNLATLGEVDNPSNSVEWIVSVSMLTEGWDVKNVFQIVPHDSRAFNSKLLIAQVLGRGLRIPLGMSGEVFVTINNHEAWTPEIGDLLNEVLEVENTLSCGYDRRRSGFLFNLHNLRYEPEQTGVESKQKMASEPEVKFLPQSRKTTESSRFSETGTLEVEIQHTDLLEIESALKIVRHFLREKDQKIAASWTKERLNKFVASRLKAAGQDATFLSKENLLRLQQGFGPMFRELDTKHPRLGQRAQTIVPVDLTAIPSQLISESMLKENGSLWVVNGDPHPFSGQDAHLWEQYKRFCKVASEDPEAASDQAKAIAASIHQVDSANFKVPFNALYVSHEPERKFGALLFERSALFDAFVKMPNTGGYSFPYSYKPAKAARTHVANESFNPDFFLKLHGHPKILVVEIKSEGDDSNRNRAKCRDGLIHFKTLNERLKAMGEEWRYHFYFLTPDDYTLFFEQVRINQFPSWRSSLMQELEI